jgi:hypothetical protein
MLSFIRMFKFVAVVTAAASILAAAPTRSYAQTTGTVHLRIVKAGFIVGVGGGDGTLTFHGRTYRLSVGGIGLGSLGVASVRLTGTASRLRVAEDIAGTYAAVGAGGAFVAGAQVATLQNEKGVTLRVHGVQMGFQVSLGLAGMTLALLQ